MSKPELIDIACELRGESQRAYRIYDGKKAEWVPKSQVEIAKEPSATPKQNDYIATMPIWLAKEKGFI